MSQYDSEVFHFWVGGIIGAVFGVIAMGISWSLAESPRDVRREAAELGYGAYVADPATGETEWRWEEPNWVFKAAREHATSDTLVITLAGPDRPDAGDKGKSK